MQSSNGVWCERGLVLGVTGGGFRVPDIDSPNIEVLEDDMRPRELVDNPLGSSSSKHIKPEAVRRHLLLEMVAIEDFSGEHIRTAEQHKNTVTKTLGRRTS